jgi:hypothetical protein
LDQTKKWAEAVLTLIIGKIFKKERELNKGFSLFDFSLIEKGLLSFLSSN